MQVKFAFGILALSAAALAAPAMHQNPTDRDLPGIDIPVEPAATNDPGDGPILGPGPVVPALGGLSRGRPIISDGSIPESVHQGLAAGIVAGGDPDVDDGAVKPSRIPFGLQLY